MTIDNEKRNHKKNILSLVIAIFGFIIMIIGMSSFYGTVAADVLGTGGVFLMVFGFILRITPIKPKLCWNCKVEIKDKDEFCRKCGIQL